MLAVALVLGLLVIPLVMESQCRAGECDGDYSYRRLAGLAAGAAVVLLGLLGAGVLLVAARSYWLGGALLAAVSLVVAVALPYVLGW